MRNLVKACLTVGFEITDKYDSGSSVLDLIKRYVLNLFPPDGVEP